MNKLIIIFLFFPLLSFAQITVSETPKFIEEVEVIKPLQIDSLSDWKDSNEAWDNEQKGNKFDYKIYKGAQIYFPINTIEYLVFTTEKKSIPSIKEIEVYKSNHLSSASDNSFLKLDTVSNITTEFKNILLPDEGNYENIFNRKITVVNPYFHTYNNTTTYSTSFSGTTYHVSSEHKSYENKYFNIIEVNASNTSDPIFKIQEKDSSTESIYCSYMELKKSILLPHYVKFKNLFEGKEFVLNRDKEVFYDFNNLQLIEAETNSIWKCKELTLLDNFNMRFNNDKINLDEFDNMTLSERKKNILSFEDYIRNNGSISNYNIDELRVFKDSSLNKMYAPYIVLQNKLHPEQLIAIEFNKDIHYKKFVDFEYDESHNIIYPENEIPGFVLKDRYDSMKLLLKIKSAKGDAETLKENGKKRIQQQKDKEEYRINQLKRKEEIIQRYGQEMGTIIANGKVRIGMTKHMCIDAWGNSIISNKTITENGTFERLQYGSGVLYFTNGVLKRIEQ